ncbi:putative glycolipid-binding domain-containing protein [Burkholderia multivorans]|uniref:putative glycolipid-binding domain-containing protein n=1 Tax=Burkholderia multivorans TaxID=87883 RepID=UPI002018FFCB|nr:putative glycolipid-binding domain-containing protein [Burkholderia multivorans]EKS9912244.1 putative glycolipid-binding domain-containing protein [Burkholderia multivorans]UQN73001.1 putative glycolipid-binding domain-containing protein [Burkholderia multivorans]UQN78736.1 putative glycolipid-binding domain-containing protein [Burkholderia multivorans]
MTQRHEPTHTHCVAWQIAQTWHAAEWCRLVDGRDGIELSGSVAGAIDGTPFRVDYAIACDADWLTRSARVTRWIGAAARQIDLRCDGGRWTIDGVDAPALAGATDVDLGFSPSTNTLPIRRLALKVGDAAAIRTAWLRFPAFDIVRGEQRYTRIAPNAYRYESGTYAADLTVDAAGLVIDYDEWRRIGATHAS